MHWSPALRWSKRAKRPQSVVHGPVGSRVIRRGDRLMCRLMSQRVLRTFARCGRIVLALCYFFASTDVAWATLDRVAPLTKTIVEPDFPCARHDCGCRTAEQCLAHCCCEPKPQLSSHCASHTESDSSASAKDEPDESADAVLDQRASTVRVSWLAAAACAGHAPGRAASDTRSLDPHLLSAAAVLKLPRSSGSLVPSCSSAPASPSGNPGDKVPI